MKRLLLLAAALFVVVGASAASRKLKNSDTEKFQYELEGVSNGAQGTYLIKVWTYSSIKKADIEKCKKNAVHGVIFKGYEASAKARGQRPLVAAPGAETEHADFFELFFKDGQRNIMVGVKNDQIVYVPFNKAIRIDKPIDRELINVLNVLSI